MGTSCLRDSRILILEPERLKNRSATPRRKITGDGKGSSARRSSGLQVQFLDVEVFSLLPQCQRNSCNLACQGEAHHGGLDAFGQRDREAVAALPSTEHQLSEFLISTVDRQAAKQEKRQGVSFATRCHPARPWPSIKFPNTIFLWIAVATNRVAVAVGRPGGC